MKILSFMLLCIPLQMLSTSIFAQGKLFNKAIESFHGGAITSVSQDSQGYIWFSCSQSGARSGIYKYDGHKITSYLHDPKNKNSLGPTSAQCLYIDSSDIIWIGTWGGGLDRFDPASNTFTHFRAADPSSISNDTIRCITEDSFGNLWIGTRGGLNSFDKKTGKFRHYFSNPNDSSSLSSNLVRVIYEDHEKTLWVGCGTLSNVDKINGDRNGGLNRFDRNTGKFTRYLHDPKNPRSIANEKVSAIFEDSKGIFWVGTVHNELHTLNRATGIFTHYHYDSAHPEKLSPPLFNPAFADDLIRFIMEDPSGNIWIGTTFQGINNYNPETKKLAHYGSTGFIHDTTSGFIYENILYAFVSKDGLLWISTSKGDLVTADLNKTIIPYHPVKGAGNTFYLNHKTNTLWIGTEYGLIEKNLITKSENTWLRYNSSGGDNGIAAMRVDAEGKLWLATTNGLIKFDPVTKAFTSYWPDENNKNSNANNISALLIDHNKNIWLATRNGMFKMNPLTGLFANYSNNPKDSSSLSHNGVECLAEDHDNKIWAGTTEGLNKLSDHTGKFQRYLAGLTVKSVFTDAKGIIWAGTDEGLYRYDSKAKTFSSYTNAGFGPENNVLHIMEDDRQNLWVSTSNSIVKINNARDSVKIYAEAYGIHHNDFAFSDNLKAPDGELFFGDQEGYYAFFPDHLKDNPVSMQLNFTSFKLGGTEIKPGDGAILSTAIWKTKEINLSYKQTAFSFEFVAIDYKSTEQPTYMFKLENYDNDWHSIGTDRKANFFNIPPGRYVFDLLAVSNDGSAAEKEISITITPPWWTRWWAYTICGLLFIFFLWAFIHFRSKALRNKNRVLEEKVTHRTQQLQQSLENLKTTQQQLVQSEKMASLGELTAGIAHEIQNPLNFVNNFSEINNELIEELKEEAGKGNIDQVHLIADGIKENEQKILHHGKRADAIVKGMLQHSRTSSGQREPTDINKIADEYLRLAYQGFRARDKSFNATTVTEFDENIGSLNMIPEEIGRVILNLINNAFYAVSEKQKQSVSGYEPTVTVSTAKFNNKVEVRVKDNGNGIPTSIKEKIFQPFFTTKPTGQGTGLGLSLAYDIVKAHGGEIKVKTQEGEGSIFTIELASG